MNSAERHKPSNKRTFYAVKVILSKKGMSFLQDIKARLANEKIRWTDPGNFHITIRFIGDTPPGTLSEVKVALDEACRKVRPFSMVVSGIGVFRSVHHARVLWLGIKDAAGISALKEITGLSTGKYLEKEENSSFTPHLTIGRMKKIDQPERLVRLLEDYRDAEFAETALSEVIFYESILSAAGPQYRALSTHPFKGVSDTPAPENGKNGIE